MCLKLFRHRKPVPEPPATPAPTASSTPSAAPATTAATAPPQLPQPSITPGPAENATKPPSMEAGLCAKCSEITLQKLMESRFFYHLTREDLIKSAKTCRLCYFLLDGLRTDFAIEYSLLDKVNSHNSFDNYVNTYQGLSMQELNVQLDQRIVLSLKPFPPPPISQRKQIEMPDFHAIYFAWAMILDNMSTKFGFKMPPLTTSSCYLRMLASPDTWPAAQGIPALETIGTNAKFDQMKAWLREDSQEWANAQSAEAQPEQVIPTRLLDLGCGDDTVKLIETDKLKLKDKQIDWITLSHRWGNCQHLTTTKGTLPQHLKGIPLEKLPQTFNDAVIVTRRLSIRYLWIDALCIVQDDKDDWKKEAAIMGSIYEHSTCTIAAHAAVNDEGGFLDSAMAAPEMVQLPAKSSDSESERENFYLSPTNDGISDLNYSPLSRRGWVLQERLLPHRIIHFTPTHIYWESSGSLGTRNEHNELLSDANYPTRPPIPRHPDQPTETPRLWLETVERYTSCGLTHSSDKLIAISGLSRQMQSRTRKGYIAGIWHDQLHLGLLWVRKPTGTSSAPSPPKRDYDLASSWSWASIDGPVAYPIAVSHHERGREQPKLTAETVLLCAIAPGCKGSDPPWIDKPAQLMLGAALRGCRVSMLAQRGRLLQRVPYVLRPAGEAGQQGEGNGGRIEPYAETAQRLGMGMLAGSEAESELLRENGYKPIGAVIEDPQISDETVLRYVVDEAANPVGWVALDDEGDPELNGPELHPGSSIELFWDFLCFKVASFRDTFGVEVTFILVVKEKPEGKPGEFVRVGMGLVKGTVYFQDVQPIMILLC